MTRIPMKPGHWLALVCLCSTGNIPAQATLPDFMQVKAAHLPTEAWLLDRNEAPLDTLRFDPDVRRLPWVPLQDLSPAMRHALIESEDKRFYQHGGVDWRAFVSAAWENLIYDTHRGASTLTMQLAGLLDPALYRAPGGRTYTQKWDQIKAAQELERTWSKQQILEAYLNRVNFRGELAGIHAAAQGLFGKQPSRLDKAEASILAALLRGPNAQPTIVARRACGVVKKLPLPRPECTAIASLASATLSRKVHRDFGEQLAPQVARRFLHNPGESVQVSLDGELQRFAIHALRARLTRKGPSENEGAIVVIDNQTGEIIAYVGSTATGTDSAPDYAGNPHPAETALHPFLYGLAIEKRLLTAASLLENSPRLVEPPVTFPSGDFDKLDGWDWVTLRTALGSSLYVPGQTTLALITPEALSARLQDIGLSQWTSPTVNGTTHVHLLALTNAYRVLANGGIYKPASFRAGYSAPGWRVMPAPVAAILTDILADKEARLYSPDLKNPLRTRGFSAVSNSSSKGDRNHWCVGFSRHYTVGVWLGSPSNETLRNRADPSGAAIVWHALIQRLHAARPGDRPKLPMGVVTQAVRFEPALEGPRDELFLSGTERSVVTLNETGETNPQILGPENGALLTLDPQIPQIWQKVRFYVHAMRPQWNWRVDGAPAPPEMLQPDGGLSYPLQPGDHRISLVDEQDQVLDNVLFHVIDPLQPSPLEPVGLEES